LAIKAIYENGVLRMLEKIEIKIVNAVRKTMGIIKVKPKIAKEIAESDELSVWGA